MTYQTTFTGGDFSAYFQIRAKLLGGKDTLGRIAVAAIGVVEMLVGGLILMTDAGGFGGMLIAMGVLFAAVGAFYYPVLGWRSAKSIPKDLGELTYSFDESGVSQAQSRGSATIEYDRIFAAAESKDVFAFFYDGTHGLFLPKRSVEDADALRDFLEEKLGFPMQQFTF